MYSPAVEKLIKLFSKLPTIGPKTAARFVFYLIDAPKTEAIQLIEAVAELKNKTKTCQTCQRAFEPTSETEKNCLICSNQKRRNSQICVVEKEVDLETIEKTKNFQGTYFILGSNISPLKEDEKDLQNKIKILLERVKTESIKEIILALNPTSEGQHTSFWLKRRLSPLDIKITQLGVGLPLGAELEYADPETIVSALEGRK
ncbi:MAG: recombination mediator RecR [Candidatus Pacebacteria bacterium]|nr:recombination mediator RecR [Candidatus Paceibacterota bacterium]